MKTLLAGLVFASILLFAQNANVAGDWIFTIPGGQGEEVNADVKLKTEGSVVTGTFSFPGGRNLEIENGSIEGNVLKLTVKRARPQGGSMTYQMTGKVDGDNITGTTAADMDGQNISMDFKAKRKS